MKIIFLIVFLFSATAQAASPLPSSSRHAMVATEQHLATQIGVDILRSGGNAIDAAVAVGYALAVTNPCCGNLGGGGFMTIHLANGKNIFLNFRERAPLAANRDMYLDKNGKVIPGKSTRGYLSVATPGTVLGLEFALKKYGTMKRQQLIAPAIKLASNGFDLTLGDVKLLKEHTDDFKKEPNVAAIFLNKNQSYEIGDRLIQKDLAESLKKISDQGAKAFYQGDIAAAIVKASQLHGGILSMKDFAEYNVESLKPVICTYHGDTVISAPPPSSGGICLCEMLNILEKVPLKKLGFQSPDSVHYITEAMRHAFYDRNNRLGDPDFVSNPVADLLSKKYGDKLRGQIDPYSATPSSQLQGLSSHHESVNTTHYSIIDKFGNAVSVTYTLDSFFGAGIIAGNTGFFLNNEMDDFTSKVGESNQFGLVEDKKNLIQGGKRPLSSMTPTIITQNNGHVLMVVGCPGGPRIITSTLLTILNVLDYGMNLQEAVDASRFHQQWLPDSIDIEPEAFAPNLLQELTKRGYRFSPQKKPWGAVEAIYIDPKTRIIYGANDKRRPAGAAIGY